MFFFGRKAERPKPAARAANSDEKRRAYRAPFEFPLRYEIADGLGPRLAAATDLSALGLRLLGDEDLPDDAVLDLRFTLPDEPIRGVEIERQIDEYRRGEKVTRRIMLPPDPFPPIALRGTVVMASINVRRRAFAHGIRFVELDPQTREHLRRYVHVWQISRLRERANLRSP